MLFRNKTLIASACALLFTAPAFAGASLDTLLSGGTIFSNNGKLLFSDFEFTPILNAPAASDIEVTTLDDGLLFGSPIEADSETDTVDYDISYRVTGIDIEIDSVFAQSNGSSSGGGEASIYKIIEKEQDQPLTQITNTFNQGGSISFSSSSFSPEAYLYVRDEVSVEANDGTAGLSDFSQTFGTSSISAVPSPTAALAGMALLGVIGIRRRRPAK
ncbi:MAG: hypothetical protein AAF085_16140 [Planctomycetota bacterium]